MAAVIQPWLSEEDAQLRAALQTLAEKGKGPL
jgi:hypothetical protein